MKNPIEERRISRRQFLTGATLGAAGFGAVVLVGCGGESENQSGIIDKTSPQKNGQEGEIKLEPRWKIYHGETYEIEFPKDWNAHDTSSDPGEIETFIANGHFSNTERDDKYIYINFSIEKLDPDETTIEDYKDREVRGILYSWGDEIIGGEEGIQESKGQKLLGQPSIELSYVKHTILNYPEHVIDYNRTNLLRMRLMGRNVIRIYYTANSADFDKYMPVFEHMASSLTLK